MLTAKESSPTGPIRATESTNKIPNENKYRGTGYPVPLVFVSDFLIKRDTMQIVTQRKDRDYEKDISFTFVSCNGAVYDAFYGICSIGS